MKKLLLTVIVIGAAVVALSHPHVKSAYPAKISAADMDGSIFQREDMTRTEHESGNVTLDVTSLKSSDGKFASGMYQSGKSYFEATDPYGVDEFMYFIEGGVTLTSADGKVTEIKAGDAVTIPKEWTGTWDTDGYTKIWVIYSEDGSGL
tara:strand:- start:4 stop:450 length:447 start_codon:yes stop_codon:yes gene_type:complete